MRTISVKVYTFEELSDKAKEKARDWWRSSDIDYDWYEQDVEDAEQIGLKITSFDIYRRDIEGKFLEGSFECAKKIIENHGEHCGTYKKAAEFLKEAEVLKTKAEESEEKGLYTKLFEREDKFLKDILAEYLKILNENYEYRYTAEFIDDMLIANEYEFTKDGKRFHVLQDCETNVE